MFKPYLVRLYLFFSFFLIVVYAEAQEDKKKLAQEYLEQARQIYREHIDAIEIAKELYAQAGNLDTTNLAANYMAGKLFLTTVNKDSASKYFLRVYRQDPKYRSDILYSIGKSFQYGLDFETALKYFEMYKRKLANEPDTTEMYRNSTETIERSIFECHNGLEIVNNPTEYSIENVGDAINSKWPEYGPVLDKDETIMIFTSRRQEGNVNENVDVDNFYYEDIFVSKKVNGKWTQAQNMGQPVSTKSHDSNLALSADGNILYLYKDANNGDIYFSKKVGAGWSEPESLLGRVNSLGFGEKSVSLSADGNLLFFSSDRDGGYGGTDIYMCMKDSKGMWSKVKNLGPEINTKYNEDSPFLHYDGRTLYFSSEGHKGYGGYDIFKSVFDSTGGKWLTPENLKYPVNTPDAEVFFVSTKDGKRGYFSSIREGCFGYTDIYMVNFHGLSFEKREKEALNAKLGKTITSNTKYDAKVVSKKYKIYFKKNESTITAEYLSEMDLIASYLKKYPELHAEISAYSSPDGNPKYNFDLSNERAMIIRHYLLHKGIDDERIIAKGYGAPDKNKAVAKDMAKIEEQRRADVTFKVF